MNKLNRKVIPVLLIIISIFLFSCSQNKNLSSVTPVPTENKATPTAGPTPVKYSIQAQEEEEKYDILIKKVQENIKKAKTAEQQQAVASYYTMEALKLIQHQNSLIIKQNDKIIELLTEIRDKK
jgi:hypothetical protein